MRVLHLPIIICSQAWEMSRALRKIGVESDYMILDDNDAIWRLPALPDYNLNIYHRQTPAEIKRIKKDLHLFFIKALLKYDIFHYHSNVPLFENYADLKILKFFGKKIVVSYWGCDVRDPQKCRKYPHNTCSICELKCLAAQSKERLTIFQKYVNAQLASMPELLEYVPGSTYFPAVVDTQFWQPSSGSNSNHTFKILHNVGNKGERGDAKGTKEIVQASERLKKEGYKIKLLSHDKVPNRDLKPYYQESDLVVEQLRCGWHGVTALEAMSMQKPVISYIRDDLKKYDPELPIINADPDTIYRVLKWAIHHPAKLKEIGKKSRAYVVKTRDLRKVGKDLLNLYQSLY